MAGFTILTARNVQKRNTIQCEPLLNWRAKKYNLVHTHRAVALCAFQTSVNTVLVDHFTQQGISRRLNCAKAALEQTLLSNTALPPWQHCILGVLSGAREYLEASLQRV